MSLITFICLIWVGIYAVVVSIETCSVREEYSESYTYLLGLATVIPGLWVIWYAWQNAPFVISVTAQ